MQPIADAPYGSRGGTVLDVAGNRLHISKPTGPGLNIFKDFRSVTPHLYAQQPVDLIEFLMRAFGGEEVYRAEMPDGSIPHAQVRIGDSIVALAGGHGPYTPMPTTLHLYVPDTDSVYEQALRAGANSIQPPADQPYGDRSAGVTDPFRQPLVHRHAHSRRCELATRRTNMKFARWVFWIAAALDLAVVYPLYRIPGTPTYYGVLATLIAWQAAFFVIGWDPK